MSGDEIYRDIHVIAEELLAPPILAPEPVPVVLVDSDSEEEDPSEHEEEPGENSGLPPGIIRRFAGMAAAGTLGGPEAHGVPAAVVESEEESEDSEEEGDYGPPAWITGGISPQPIPSEVGIEDVELPGAQGAPAVAVESEHSEEEEVNPEVGEALVQLGALVHYLIDRNSELNIQVHDAENRAQLHEARAHDFYMEKQRAQDLAKDLEQEVRVHKRKADRMHYAYTTSTDRLIDRVVFFPEETGQTFHTITRQRVVTIAKQERKSAIAKGLV